MASRSNDAGSFRRGETADLEPANAEQQRGSPTLLQQCESEMLTAFSPRQDENDVGLFKGSDAASQS